MMKDSHGKSPVKIDLTPDEFDALVQRIETNQLSQTDRQLLIKVLMFYRWLQHSLSEAKLTIKRLSSLFGISAFKRRRESAKKKSDAGKKNDDKDSHQETNKEEQTNPKENHGRNDHHAYKDAETIKLQHPVLKPGDPCTLQCGGRLYEIDPGVVIRVTGNAIASAIRYIQQKLRCSLCGERFTAALPDEVSPTDRYDEKIKAVLALQKYFLGSPFYRMEAFHNMLGLPLSDAVQWDLVEQVADCVYPIYQTMMIEAAQGKVIHNNDTTARILSLIKENKNFVFDERKSG